MGAQTMEFDEAVQAVYGLERLEIRECELRYGRDVEDALADVDMLVFTASAFNSFRQRLPDRLDRVLALTCLDLTGLDMTCWGGLYSEIHCIQAVFTSGSRYSVKYMHSKCPTPVFLCVTKKTIEKENISLIVENNKRLYTYT